MQKQSTYKYTEIKRDYEEEKVDRVREEDEKKPEPQSYSNRQSNALKDNSYSSTT